MKKTILILAAFLCVNFGMRAEINALNAESQYAEAGHIGVPSECEDVMLQAFYWDSYDADKSTTKYGRTKWIDLQKDTTAICRDFDLVWFPPCAKSTGGVGYYHTQLSNLDGAWGTKIPLNKLIEALHRGNTKCIADIVINHRGNKSSWVDFYSDNFGTYGSFQLKQEHICAGDEAFTDSSSPYKGDSNHGANDTGTNDGGCRDLDHTSEYVQNWAKAYVQWMLKVMQFDGFRYDMTLGYHGRYMKMYNEAAQPYFSVSECWESISRQKQHLQECEYNTMVFDFQQKYELKKAIIDGSYGKLKKNSNSFRGQGLEKYAVTFIDNHDTFARDSYGSQQFGGNDLTNPTTKAQILQANAYILMMPGVPCVFWPHWKSYQNEISELIAIRKRAGIHSESEVLEETSGQYQYSATVQGHRGKVVVRVGKNRSMVAPEGFEQVANGDHYTVYLKEEAPEGITNHELPITNGEKFVKDGRLYIKYNGRMYNVQGGREN